MGKYDSPLISAFRQQNADATNKTTDLFKALIEQKRQGEQEQANIASQGKNQLANTAAQGSNQLANTGEEGNQQRQTLQTKSDLQDQLQGKEVKRATDLRELLGSKTGVKIGDTALTPKDTAMADQRAENMKEKQQEGLSKRYEKTNGFASALQDIENLTNKANNGTGGIVSNPNATMSSAGKMMSSVPTSLIGVGEMLGAVPKGASEERKALERLKLEYQKSMTGARTSAQMAQQEGQAMGWMASGDPQLVAKGVRALANNVQNATKAIQGGYTPEVRGRVHSMTGDPLEQGAMSHVYHDNADEAQPPQGAPAPAPVDPKRARLEELRRKKAGL